MVSVIGATGLSLLLNNRTPPDLPLLVLIFAKPDIEQETFSIGTRF